MKRFSSAFALVLLAAACGPREQTPPAPPPSAAAPMPASDAEVVTASDVPVAEDAAAAALPSSDASDAPGAAANRFFIGLWAPSAQQCKQPWTITDGRLITPGNTRCRFVEYSEKADGMEVDARCTVEAGPRPYRLKFIQAQSAKALLVEGGPFKDAGLVRCGDAPPDVEPRDPGTPGGLPDDRTPISEAPFTPTSAQGAADVVQVYFASVSIDDYGKAWRQLGPEARAKFGSEAAFHKRFAAYQQYQAQVGAPGQIEGAAGSLYVEVPVQVYGRRRTGEEVHALGKATLRRVNDVPGSTPEQRLWRIAKLTVEP